jgi:two-component system OmpR family response regulator
MTRVLFVEDEEDLRTVYAEILEDAGFQVSAVESVPDGIRMHREHLFDVVVTDFRVGNDTGGRLIREVRSFDSSARILLMSGTFLDAAEGALFGADLTLKKPLKPIDLLKGVRALLEKG